MCYSEPFSLNSIYLASRISADGQSEGIAANSEFSAPFFIRKCRPEQISLFLAL